MGVAGAFVFAAQMLNFAIPGTGSSGHLGGALLLAILLGPEAAFLVMASILAVQALFFADGGLLALGCNIFNLGFFPAFVAYPLVYRRIVGDGPDLRAGRVVHRLAAGGDRRAAARRPRRGARDDRLRGHRAAVLDVPAAHAADPPRHRRRRGARDGRRRALRLPGAARAAGAQRREALAARAAPQAGRRRRSPWRRWSPAPDSLAWFVHAARRSRVVDRRRGARGCAGPWRCGSRDYLRSARRGGRRGRGGAHGRRPASSRRAAQRAGDETTRRRQA